MARPQVTLVTKVPDLYEHGPSSDIGDKFRLRCALFSSDIGDKCTVRSSWSATPDIHRPTDFFFTLNQAVINQMAQPSQSPESLDISTLQMTR